MSIWRHLSVRTDLIVILAVVLLANVGSNFLCRGTGAAKDRQAAAMRDDWLPSTQSPRQLGTQVGFEQVKRTKPLPVATAGEEAGQATGLTEIAAAISLMTRKGND